MRPAYLVGSAILAASLAPPEEARAEPSDEFIVASIVAGAVFGLADTVLLSYDMVQADEQVEPEKNWMIAQTVITVPQVAVGVFMSAFAQIDDDRDGAPLMTLVGLPATTLANGLFVFGVWSLEGSPLPLDARMGVSMMIGVNTTLTIEAVTATLAKPHFSRPHLAVPELLFGVAEAIPSFVQAAADRAHTKEWMGMGLWSSVLAAHGALSLVATVGDLGRDDDYAWGAPRNASSGASWAFAPAVLRPPWRVDGGGQAPGIVAAGRF